MVFPYPPIFWLLVAHFFGDFAFQTSFLAKNKKTIPLALIAHCFIWSGCICLVLSFIDGPGFALSWPKLLMLVLGHLAIDLYKEAMGERSGKYTLYVDQVLHLLQLILAMCPF